MGRGMYVLAVATCVALVGCGGGTPTSSAGDTPEAAAKAFAQALADDNTELAATYWAYDEQARKDNPDWDSFPPGQRSQIKRKLRESKASELGSHTGLFADVSGALEASAEGETVTVSADGQPLAVVSVTKTDAGYQVAGLAPIG
ncbi:MAG: hypothetical protein GF320_13060 [Armatimonadia bacterium]|nr:hypothetical protein [Armatimonadia bacterium]